MNGADMLCDVLLANGIDVCFANPGTSEMHFVAALDRKPLMRCVLGLSEGVVTGAADGYARMAQKPAATLLHLGPGLANGLANLHNARRARTPILNIVGDHASYHLCYDAPLTTDIESLARPMSHWVGRAVAAASVRRTTEEALSFSMAGRGVSTMILPADAAWGEVSEDRPRAMSAPAVTPPDRDAIELAAKALRSGKSAVIILAGQALMEGPLELAGRIAASSGAALYSEQSGRYARGAGRPIVHAVPYNIDVAVEALSRYEVAICIGATEPVAFFAYPGKPSKLLPQGCEVIQVARHEHDLGAVLDELAEALGGSPDVEVSRGRFIQNEIEVPKGYLTAGSLSLAIARYLPADAIVVDESLTSPGHYHSVSAGLHPHDYLPQTGGAIGIGIPLATGAAIGAPGRRVITLQADGSGMYTLQALWTQAREGLDVITIILANNAYRILLGEMAKVGVDEIGNNARKMLNLDRPKLDWCALADGLGVESGRARTGEEFVKLYRGALTRKGPFLIEATIP